MTESTTCPRVRSEESISTAPSALRSGAYLREESILSRARSDSLTASAVCMAIPFSTSSFCRLEARTSADAVR